MYKYIIRRRSKYLKQSFSVSLKPTPSLHLPLLTPFTMPSSHALRVDIFALHACTRMGLELGREAKMDRERESNE